MSELSCWQIVELVTDFIEDAMSPDERRRFEDHLSSCPGCVTYVEQIRETIRATGTLPSEETLSPELRAALVEQFRHWQRSP